VCPKRTLSQKCRDKRSVITRSINELAAVCNRKKTRGGRSRCRRRLAKRARKWRRRMSRKCPDTLDETDQDGAADTAHAPRR
jgi:hypothetical protein